MPGLRIYFSLLGDDRERLEVWCPTIRQPIRLLRCLIFRQLKNHNFNNSLPESWEKIKLFFNGQELQDQYAIGTYGIVEDNVIQVMISTSLSSSNNIQRLEETEPESKKLKTGSFKIEESENTDDPLKSKSEIESLQKDDYYEIGNHVDAFNTSTGSWFPARIVAIKRDRSTNCRDDDDNDQIYYYVAFDKPSLGNYVAKRLAYIRPQPYQMIERKQLEPGQLVMVLNSSCYGGDGQWYVGAIEMIKRSQKDRSIRLWLAMVTEGDQMPLVQQMIKFRHGNIFRLESNVKICKRSQELDQIIKFGSKINRHIEPDCCECQDDFQKPECFECGCQVCHQKVEPSKQLVCDECQRSVHFWCLKNPVESVPEEPEWYCDQCRNDTREEILEKQKNHLDLNQKLNAFSNYNWGFGMACVGRSALTKNTSSKSNIFGPISGVFVGTWWRFRVQVSEAGVHAPLVAGIHGRENIGAYSVVYSAMNPQDLDLGDEIYYTANGGGIRKKSSNRSIFGSQQLKREILALARNCPIEVNQQTGGNASGPDKNLWRKGNPVRLLRSGNGRIPKDRRSRYLPKVGIRYDGLYKVVKYWPEAGINGHRVWRFLLRRDDPEPAPWTEAGRYRSRKLGLILQYPPGWCEEVAQKRSWKIDKKILTKQNKNLKNKNKIQTTCDKQPDEKSEYFQIPEYLQQLTKLDELNSKIWSILMETKPMTKQEFIQNVTESFRCVCCMDMVQDPLTTDCGHNFCLKCIQQLLDSNPDKDECPLCREKSFLSRNQMKSIKSNKNQTNGSKPSTKIMKILKTNTILKKILLQIKSL